MLQNSHEIDQSPCVISATCICPEQGMYRKYMINQYQKGKGYALKDLIFDFA